MHGALRIWDDRNLFESRLPVSRHSLTLMESLHFYYCCRRLPPSSSSSLRLVVRRACIFHFYSLFFFPIVFFHRIQTSCVCNWMCVRSKQQQPCNWTIRSTYVVCILQTNAKMRIMHDGSCILRIDGKTASLWCCVCFCFVDLLESEIRLHILPCTSLAWMNAMIVVKDTKQFNKFNDLYHDFWVK